MQNKIVIIDYGIGNLRSVQKKFNRINIDVLISSEPEEIEKATKLIIPGVGHFANVVRRLKEYSIDNILNERVLKDKIPILGIYLGMQLLVKRSEEGDMKGLGWFDADELDLKLNIK